MSGYLFAYGTLRPGFAPESVAPMVDRLELVGEGFLQGLLYDLGEYPGLVLDSRASELVFGSIFRLPDEGDFLRELDAYEGYEADCPEASLFLRVEAAVAMADGGVVGCWVYVYRGAVDGLPVIAGWPA